MIEKNKLLLNLAECGIDTDREDMEVFAIVKQNKARAVDLDTRCLVEHHADMVLIDRPKRSAVWLWYVIYGIILISLAGCLGFVAIGTIAALSNPGSRYFWPVIIIWMIALAMFAFINNIKEEKKCRI